LNHVTLPSFRFEWLHRQCDFNTFPPPVKRMRDRTVLAVLSL
jgi:hypothetical protein